MDMREIRGSGKQAKEEGYVESHLCMEKDKEGKEFIKRWIRNLLWL